MERQLVIQDVVQILLHEDHGAGETVLLVVSAVVHVGVITEEGGHKDRSANGVKAFELSDGAHEEINIIQ